MYVLTGLLPSSVTFHDEYVCRHTQRHPRSPRQLPRGLHQCHKPQAGCSSPTPLPPRSLPAVTPQGGHMGTGPLPASHPAAFGGSRGTKGFIHGLDVFLKHCLSLKEPITQYTHSGRWFGVLANYRCSFLGKKNPRKVSPFFLFSLIRKMGFCMSGFSRGRIPWNHVYGAA